MRCPECNTTENIKWMLRHQKIDENDTSTVANVLTILCTECGKNESIFIADYLEDVFPSWDNKKDKFKKEYKNGSVPLIFDDNLIYDEDKEEEDNALSDENDKS